MKTKEKQRRYAAMSAALTAVVIAAVLVVNLLAGAAEKRFSLTLDMTGDSLYALSDETKEFLSNMTENFTITVLGDEVKFSQGVRTGVISEILKRYRSASGGRIALQYVDTYTNPGILAKYPDETIEENGLIIEGGSGHRTISMSELFGAQTSQVTLKAQITDCRAEQVLTSALLKLSADTQPEVYLVEGHGETYYDGMVSRIESGSCKLARLSLLTEEIPRTAALLIISAPQADFSAEELERLDDYLKGFGNLILLYGSDSPDLPNLDRYLTEWGVRFEKNIIVDPARYVGNAVQISPLLTGARINEACAPLSDRFLLTPGARAIELLWESRGKREAEPVLVTGEQSYAKSYAGESGLISTVEKEQGDQSGVMNTGVLVRSYDVSGADLSVGSVLFLSSPSMFSDSLLDTPNLLNDFYFSNALSYMTGGAADFVSIPARNMKDGALNTVGTGNGLLFFAVVLLPSGAVLLFGIWRWLSRRKL